MLRRLTLFALVCSSLWSFSASQGQTLDATLSGCAQCHGPTGISQLPETPHLDRQLAGAIEEAMLAYSEARRQTAVPLHKQVPRELVSGVAAFYSGQKSGMRPAQNVDALKVAQGEAVYNRHCYKCHDDAGRESDNEAPLLAGQNLDYLLKQVMAYKDGSRKQPAMMERASRGVSEEDWIATAHFFAAQDAVGPAIGKKKRRRSGQ